MNNDYFLFQGINNLADKSLIGDKIGIFIAQYLPYFLFLIALGFIVYQIWKKKNWKLLFQVIGATILSRLFITEIIRFLYYRPRPFVLHQVNQLLIHRANGSFPSGHMAFLFALSVVVYFSNKKLGWSLCILSFLVGLARIFVGVHYPLDILAGIIIGIFSGFLIKKLPP